MAKASELRQMSEEQLTLNLKEAQESLFRLRITSQTQKLNAPTELKRHRRLIARIQTIQNEKKRAAAPTTA